MTVLAQRHTAALEQRPAAASRDLHTWEARVRRILRPAAVELVDGSREQRHRLAAAGVRRGTFQRPGELAVHADLSGLALRDLLTGEHRELYDDDVAAGPGTDAPADEALGEALALRALKGASLGRTAWTVPFSSTGTGAPGPQLGLLFTDSPVAVLALQEEARTGRDALARIEGGEPWTAFVHSVGLPLDDEHGTPLRDDAPWPEGVRLRVRLRGGTEVWSCGSPVAWT